MNFPYRFRLPANPLKLIESLVFTLILTACTPMMQFVLRGGEESKQNLIRAHRSGPYMLIFAMDGVGHDQMMEALQSGATPWLSTLLGARQRNGGFEHAYSVSNAQHLTLQHDSRVVVDLYRKRSGVQWHFRQ